MLTGQQFIQDHAETEQVRAPVDEMPLPVRLFRAHVGGSAGIAKAFSVILLAHGETEINQVRLVARLQQDVDRFDIAVHEAVLVGVIKGLGDLHHQFGRLADRKGRGAVPFRQIAAHDELGDDKRQAVFRSAHIEHRNNVRVIQAGQNLGLDQISLDVPQREDRVGLGDLDRDLAFEFLVPREIDDAKAPLAQHFLDLVAADALQSQFLGRLSQQRIFGRRPIRFGLVGMRQRVGIESVILKKMLKGGGDVIVR